MDLTDKLVELSEKGYKIEFCQTYSTGQLEINLRKNIVGNTHVSTYVASYARIYHSDVAPDTMIVAILDHLKKCFDEPDKLPTII